MKLQVFNVALCLCVFMCLPWLVKGQDSGRLAHVKAQYSFTNWVGTTKTNYTFLVTNWVPDFLSIGVINFVLRDEGAWANNRKNSVYLFHPNNNPNVTVDCRVNEREGVTNAQNAMMEDFATCAAIQPFPFGVSYGVDVGDRCYLGYPANANANIIFSRNNVFVTVSADATNYSVKSIAEELDNQLKTISTMEPSIPPGAILEARVTLKPEALEVSPGILTAFVRLPEGYPVSGITSATCDGAPSERMMLNDDGTEMIIKFRRRDIENALAQIGESLDTNFVVRGVWRGAAGTNLFQGTDSITKIVGAKEKKK